MLCGTPAQIADLNKSTAQHESIRLIAQIKDSVAFRKTNVWLSCYPFEQNIFWIQCILETSGKQKGQSLVVHVCGVVTPQEDALLGAKSALAF